MIRLNKYLANLGVASRRKVDLLIETGSITVNGKNIYDLGIKIDPKKDTITVQGKPIATKQTLVYQILHKPRGVVSTAADEHNRETVVEVVKHDQRLYPVGRLDQDTIGLLLLTNDGDLTYRLTHPKFSVPKTYQATVRGPVPESILTKLRQGVQLKDGLTAPADVEVLEQVPHRWLLAITIHEGKNRQIRRMLGAVGIELLELKRVSFGPLKLGSLALGQHRSLSPVEVKTLKDLIAYNKK